MIDKKSRERERESSGLPKYSSHGERSLKMRLIAYFLVIAVLVAVVGGIAFYTNTRIKVDVNQMTESNLEEVEGATEMAFYLQKSQTGVQELLAETYRGIIEPEAAAAAAAAKEAEEEIPESLEKFEEHLASYKKASETGIQMAEEGGEPEEAVEEREELEKLEELEEEFTAYKNNVHQYINLVKTDLEDADEFLEETLEPHFRTKLLPLVREFEEDSETELKNEGEEIKEAITTGNMLIISLAVICVLLAIGLGFYVSKRITTPIEKLSKTVDEVSKGNFKVEVEKTTGIKEINVLAESLDRIMKTMKVAVMKMREKK